MIPKNKKQQFAKDNSIQSLYTLYKELERKKSVTTQGKKQIEQEQKKMMDHRILEIKEFATNYIGHRAQQLGEKFKNISKNHIPDAITWGKEGYLISFLDVTCKNNKTMSVLVTEDELLRYASIQELASQQYPTSNSEDRRVYLDALLKLQKDEKEYVLSKQTTVELNNIETSIAHRILVENKVVKQKLISLKKRVSDNIDTRDIKHLNEMKAQEIKVVAEEQEFDFLPLTDEESQTSSRPPSFKR